MSPTDVKFGHHGSRMAASSLSQWTASPSEPARASSWVDGRTLGSETAGIVLLDMVWGTIMPGSNQGTSFLVGDQCI